MPSGINHQLWVGDQADLNFMSEALKLAATAESAGEVPIGAVLVSNNRIIGEGWNNPVGLNDPTSHAEMSAIRMACQQSSNYRVTDATLYVTLMPCLMCWGAIFHARINRVVVGCQTSRFSPPITQLKEYFSNPDMAWGHCTLETNCRDQESQALLTRFFKSKRRSREEALANMDSLSLLPNVSGALLVWLSQHGYDTGKDLLTNGLPNSVRSLRSLVSQSTLPQKEQAMLAALCHYLEGNPVLSWKHFLNSAASDSKPTHQKN